MSVVFDEVVGTVEPPEPAPQEQAEGGGGSEDHQAEYVRMEIGRLMERIARLRAD